MITSIFHLLALASNHYVTILKPLKYYSTVTADVIVPVVLSMWLLPPAGFLLYFSLLPGQAFRSDYCRGIGFLIQFKFRLFVAATIFIPLVIMMFLYAHILLLIIKSRRRQSLGFRRASLPSNQKFQSVTTTALMLGTYVLGWLPNVLFFISHCENCFFPLQNYGLQVFWLTVFTNALIIFKCIVDPIIYGARVNEIREALLLMNLRCLAAVHRNPSKFDTRRRRTGLMNITMADPR